jgi:GT2 family glycosyltransferase
MISLLVVNLRSAALAAEAVRTARLASSSEVQVVIVDNSCDVAEAEALRDIADVLIVSKTNRGYAGAINDGRRACTGDVIVIANPDVTFAPRSIDLLANALDGKYAAAGPALFWDDAHEWHLPPGDLLTAPQKLDEVFASRSPAWHEQRDHRRIVRRMRFWTLEQTQRVKMLSGAVMAVRARTFDELGGFDERFALYFEETDFFRRLGQNHKRIAYVPDARCRHLYNQSAAQTGDLAATRYAESERKYLEKWNGPWLAGFLKRIERPVVVAEVPLHQGPLHLDRDDVLIEASPLASFATAAGCFPRGHTIEVPAEVWRSVGESPLYVRVIARDTAQVLTTVRISP